MKIISNFKDYYDSMQQYGADDTTIFNRINPPREDNQIINFDSNIWKIQSLNNEVSNPSIIKKIDNEIDSLPEDKTFKQFKKYFSSLSNYGIIEPHVLQSIVTVVNGIPFRSYVICAIHDNSAEYKMIKKNATHQDCFDYLKEVLHKTQSSHLKFIFKAFNKFKNIDDFYNYNHSQHSYAYFSKHYKADPLNTEDLINIHKEVQNPIYYIVDNKVLTNIPLLYFGINNLFDNNIPLLYQEIEYCLTNIIQNKNEPPEVISNEMKIIQHGFDKKISFRKRMN